MKCAKCGATIARGDNIKIKNKNYCCLVCAGVAEELPVKYKLKENKE